MSESFKRRMEKLDKTPEREIAKAIDALKFIDDQEIRHELAKPLLEAQMGVSNAGSDSGE